VTPLPSLIPPPLIHPPEKYGIIPKTLYPESFSSSASAKLDSLLTSKLREYASILRSTSSSSSNLTSLRRLKSKFLAEVFTTLTIALGTPPKPDEKLTWDYNDRDGKFHTWSGTPLEFYEKWGKRKGMDPGESFSLINDPRNVYEKLYTVDRLGNVYGGRPISCEWIHAKESLLYRADLVG
jgi:bleomycin hydrolase